MMGSAALLCVLSLLEAVAGSALDDTTIRTAVAAWLSDSAAAEAAYGHISTWETGGVTDMSYLFCGTTSSACNTAAASFNEDIGAWDTSGVTTMIYMFKEASAFNRDISGWAVDSVTTMSYMFERASAFNQDISAWDTSGVMSMYRMFHTAAAFNQVLGWCVDDDVNLLNAFDNTMCVSTSCGIAGVDCDVSRTGNIMVSWKIKQAVAAWLSDATAAEATYGHISTWETGGVTDMSKLFCANSWCSYYNAAAATFNKDIRAWNTSGVKSMAYMFRDASAFNRDIGGWPVHSVTNMHFMFGGASKFNRDIGDWAVQSVIDMGYMFRDASKFNQDLGWCVDDDVDLTNAFYRTPCESTSCGVVRCPTKENDKDIPVAVIVGVAAAVLLLVVGAFCFYRRRKASMTDKADEPSGADREPTELSPPEEATTPKEATGPESLETRAAAKAKATETVELSSFSKKLTSFLFGEQEEALKEEEAAIPVAPEGEEASTEQPPPPPPRRWFSRAEPEPAAPKAEEMYNQIAAWYNAPENAALREIWGAYPEPDDFQTWPGFVAVTNAYLDREAG